MCSTENARTKPDVSNINIQIQFLRFDEDLMKFQKNDFHPWRDSMKSKYGEFYDFYLSQFVIGPRPAHDTADIDEAAIKKFVTDTFVVRIQDSISNRFANSEDVEEQLAQTFRYFKFYVPEFQVPQIVTINSMYSTGASPFGNEQFIVGLDMFLGDDNHDYDSAGIYDYVRHKMKREYIARFVAESLYDDYFSQNENPDEILLDAIVNRGKKMYFLSYIFPDAPDSLILGYTQAQAAWCEKSELSIWKFFNEKDLLYKNSGMDKTRYLGEGPTTSGMPLDAPGSIGNFLGLKIVRKFMEQADGKVSLHDLITKLDAKTIFEKSKYRPSK